MSKELGEVIDVKNIQQRDSLNQVIGRMKMTASISKLMTVGYLRDLHVIKENKLYRVFKGEVGTSSDGKKIADVGTWDGFCKHIGFSRQKVDEDLINLALFGEDAYESLQAVGLGYREIRQIRSLPEEQRLEIQGKVIDAGDKGEVKALIEEFVIENTDLKDDIEAIEREATKQEKAAETYRLELLEAKERLKEKVKPGPLPEYVENIRISSTTWTEEAIDCLDRMESLFGKLSHPEIEMDIKSPDFQSNYDVAATTYAFNIRYILAKVSRMVKLCNKELGDDIREEIMDIPVLDDKQIAHINSARKLMRDEHDLKDKYIGHKVANKTNKRGRRPGTKVAKKATKKAAKK
ncbi:MAG: hypothetical protein ACN4GR_16315 [Arenicellales bacterium]